MKLLFLLLTITFSQLISAQPGLAGGYSEVPPSEYENDVQIQRALYYGAHEVIQQGIEEGRLPSSPPFKITKIDSVEEQVVAGLNYKFAVELSNGEMTVSATYVVYQQAGTGDLSVSSPSFDITSASNRLPLLIDPSDEEDEEEDEEEEDGLLGEWHSVDVSTLNTDSNLRDLLNYGVQDIITKEGTNYYIEDVDSIEEQLVSGTNARFNVTLGDDEGNEVAVSFTVYDEPWTGRREISGYEFIANEGEEEHLLGSWESVDVSELYTDPILKEIFDYGFREVIDQGVSNGLLLTPNYQPSKIYSIKTQLVSGTNSRFNIEVENDVGGTAHIIFVVYDEPWTNTREVTSYLFLDISSAVDIPLLLQPRPEDGDGLLGEWTAVDVTTLNTDSNLRDLLSFGVQHAIVQGIEDEKLPDAEYYIEDVASIETQLVSGTNTRFNITLGDTVGNEIAISFTVYDESWTDIRDFRGYELIKGEGEEEDVFGSWESVDIGDLDTNQLLQEIFEYGVGQVAGHLSGSGYQVEEIYSIKTQLVSGTNYRFNLKLENGAGASATVIFVVWDEPWTNTRQVVLYLFLDIQEAGIEENVGEDQDSGLIDGGASD